jgi:hypothetical protein
MSDCSPAFVILFGCCFLSTSFCFCKAASDSFLFVYKTSMFAVFDLHFTIFRAHMRNSPYLCSLILREMCCHRLYSKPAILAEIKSGIWIYSIFSLKGSDTRFSTSVFFYQTTPDTRVKAFLNMASYLRSKSTKLVSPLWHAQRSHWHRCDMTPLWLRTSYSSGSGYL